MSRNLHPKRSPWITIDETGSEEDDCLPSMDENSDYEVKYRSSKVSAGDTVWNKASVTNPDKQNRRVNTTEKDKAIDSKSTASKTRETGVNNREKRKLQTDFGMITDKNAIVIDDEDDKDVKTEACVPATHRKRKGSADKIPAKKVRITRTSSLKKKLVQGKEDERCSGARSEIETLGDEKGDECDSVVEYQISKRTNRKDKDKVPVFNSNKPSTREKDTRANTSTATTKVKSKRLNSKVNAREEQTSAEADITLLLGNEIIIDDEVDEDIESKNTKRKGSSKITARKNAQMVRAPSSKKALEIEKTGENRNAVTSQIKKLGRDEEEDSDSVIDYHCSKQTGRARGKLPMIDVNEPNHKGKDVRTTTNNVVIEVEEKGFKSESRVEKKEGLSEPNVTLSSENEITIMDEDDKNIQLETRLQNRSIKRKRRLAETIDVKRSKTIRATSSKQKSSDQNIFKVDSVSKVENEGLNDHVKYQSLKKSGIEGRDKVSVIGCDEPTHEMSIGRNDVTVKTHTAKRERKNSRFDSNTEVTDKQELLEFDVLLSSQKPIAMYDDDDDENIKLGTKVPMKNLKQKGSNKTTVSGKPETVQATSSKQRLKTNGEDKNSSALVPEDNKYEKNDSIVKSNTEWSESDYLIEFNQINPQIAGNLVSLFKNDNTIPFIARYRKEMTGGMEPEELRNIKNTYDNIKLVKQRALLILKTIDKLGKWSPEIHSAVTSAKTMNELDMIYSPFKPGSKGSLAERAKELGLAPIGQAILQGRAIPHLSTLIDRGRDGLRNETDVRNGIMHIIADVISKDTTTFEGIHKLRKSTVINIEAKRSKSVSSPKSNKDGNQKNDHQKYENYFNFSSSERFIKDYQILAINRGESQKILTVKINIPDWFQNRLRDHCLEKYNFVKRVSNFHYQVLEESFNDAYNRLIKPLVVRQVRHDLNERAERAAIEVFANNLKKLLLTPPLRGKTVLGIDPGFNHGCKLAVISHCGNVLDTATIYPHTKSKSNLEQQVQVLANLVKKHRCTIFALGNATACRETEMFLTGLIQAGIFTPLDVSYTIVNEAGASVYSCSSEAKSEFPSLDPNIISAISIARRLQDPLAELIKVEPQHLGIGMYQHDLPKKQLQLTLDEVITETVSFIGVDINTASYCLLRKVAGLSPARAKNIIEQRDKKGPFFNRQELLEVKGIGKKIFEQCAGFIRILPETALIGSSSPSKKYSLDYLDQTWIHPESYNIARGFVTACKCDLDEIGTESFIQKVLSYADGRAKILATQFDTSEASMDIIIKGLSMKKGEDIRVKEDGPLFQKNFRCMDDLCVNTRLTGSVRNVTDFGTFVDIGVEKAGLIPLGKMRGQTLSLGQRVEVIVLSVDKVRGRIALSL